VRDVVFNLLARANTYTPLATVEIKMRPAPGAAAVW